jgi:KUP system potassium uptake protein
VDHKSGGAPVATSHAKPPKQDPAGPLPLAALTALGVVYGDLGTSPLYTMQTVLQVTGSKFDGASALGVLSLFLWTLLVTISIKYCVFVMRADNHGEGGILSLMSLTGVRGWRKGTYVAAAMGVAGAALIYGDGVITPAISVLSAVEGVNVATTALKPYILPIAVGILAALFLVQRVGTAKIGGAFGPVMLVWFVLIGLLGLNRAVAHPEVLEAINPVYGLRFLIHAGPKALLVLGGVFLCCTGGEALYADMGHVGRLPTRLAWYGIVLPALLLNYAGQTAVLIEGHAGGGNPFFTLAPSWALYPLVGLATVATIIASQAIITGVFSMTRQGIQLGWLPQIEVRQTSKKAYGQIYVPPVNWIMAGVTIAITLAFKSSDRLAGAYGTAVSTTMLLTSFLLFRAMTRTWKWPLWLAMAIIAPLLIVDAAFFVANLVKIADGGWVPLGLAALVFTLMLTWRQGVQAVRHKVGQNALPIDRFLANLSTDKIMRPSGVAAFLTRTSDRTPPLVAEYVRLTRSLPETVVALSLEFEEAPRVGADRRASFEQLAEGFWRVTLRYGFMQTPDLSKGIAGLTDFGEKVDMSDALFFGTRDFITRADERPHMARWRTSLFAFLYRNGVRTPDLFDLPPDRTVEIARQIEI